ncbi:MAG: tryptophan--tRNA ligase [Alphaproteobacteria bacterium]
MERIFSGAQPTGNLHLGNYLGAIRNWVKLQDTYECVYCVVDMHAITIFKEPEELVHNVHEVAACMLAAGVDPKRHILFNQSRVPAHAQLAWVLNCTARMGWMSRMTQFKDKAGKNRENASLGLFAYPSLMAADILVYKATHVPVGEDQKQHLELARDIAVKFNNDFRRDVFPLPEPVMLGTSRRVMSLRDATKKMSKSDPSDYSRINLADDADTIALKIRKAKTDPLPLPETMEGFEGRPEALNLVNIYAGIQDITTEEALKQIGGQEFSQFKKTLADVVVAELAPITSEMRRISADIPYIDSVLREGGERADALARPVLEEVYDTIGFLRN